MEGLIYAADGTHARKTVVPFRAAHCRWFLEGGAFLEHVGADLATVSVVALCRHCLAADADAAVRTTPQPDQQRVLVSCGHRAGRVQTDRPLALQALLDALGWTLRCPHCGEDVQGDNDQTATVFTIRCRCTTREFRLPVA